MIMESPVRICLGAALVVHLLLLFGLSVSGNALPLETTSATVKDERNSRFSRSNSTWTNRNNQKIPDVALNELRPKDSASEEHTEKNAKYKDRGRVRFNPLAKSTTESTLKRVRTSTEPSNIIIVTPTPEVKKPAQIIDSMRNYKKTKMPVIVSSTEASVSAKTKFESDEDYYENYEEERNSYDKYTSFDDFFTMSDFGNEDFSNKKDKRGSGKKTKEDYSTPSFDSFSSFFPKDTYSSQDEPYKSESFFDFESELTTPKNDYFDKKFKEISSSILNNLDIIKGKSQPPNITNVHKIVKENIDLERMSNGTPNNKSTVIIKNTKEIRLVDNEKAGTSNKELSDVHGTSIYYEMSVLSTETYNITHTDEDDCDNDTLPSETVTTTRDELPSLKATLPTIVELTTKPMLPDSIPDAYSTVPTNFLPVSIVPSLFNSISPVAYSTQNYVSSTESARSKVFSSSFSRSRNYSKRLNLAGAKDSPNSVTVQADQVSINQGFRPITRRFHHTTPKVKPIWMAPRKNITRGTYSRSTYPTTIYSEHFNIKDKFSSTIKPRQPTRTVLTTLPSDIDPVLQSDNGGLKKIVHSPSISDNTIPTLWKRGSTKFSTSTATSSEVGSGVSEMEIPPTLTAWALASLRSPPSLASPVVNSTGLTQNSVDENELQKVGAVLDKRESTTSSTTTSSFGIINNEILPKNESGAEQSFLWKPLFVTTSPNSNEVSQVKSSESKSETLPAESNISIQSSLQPDSTTKAMNIGSSENSDSTTIADIKPSIKDIKPSWIPATMELYETTTEETRESSKVETIPPVDATKSTGFESITKLAAGLTTPTDETSVISEEKNETLTEKISLVPTTTDYQITTIRFSYVPTEEVTESTETEPSTIWHPVVPTKTKKANIKDTPITTYRPIYMTTTNTIEDSTTYTPDTTEQVEVSSQMIENETKKSVAQEMSTTDVLSTVHTTTENLRMTTTEEVKETTPVFETTTMKETTTETTKFETTETTTQSEEETTTAAIEASTETDVPQTDTHESGIESEENSSSNEIIQPTTQAPKVTSPLVTELATPPELTTTTESTTRITTVVTEAVQESTTETVAKIVEITSSEEVDSTTEGRTLTEDYTVYTEMTTESSSRVLTDEAGTGAAIAIAVSTIGVIALVLLVGLLLVVRRRGRRGVYAQRCTPVSLDAYSLDSVSVGQRKGNQRLRASKRSYGNPAYDDEVTSHPMNYAALANFALDVDSMSAEFAEIPSVTVRPDEVPPGCEDKNRYSNVLPLPETRVPLKRLGNDPTTEYINANYVTGPGNIRNYYIMCQAPLNNTVADFWRMIWEQNSRLIVMLTEYMENGVEKCYEYLPPSEISDNRRTFGDFQIILKKREQRDKYAISSVQLINLNTRTWREVTHLWYFWPAKGVPDDYDSVIDFLSEMRSYMKISQNAKEYDEEGVEVIYGENRSSFNNLSKLRSDDSGSGNGVNVYSPAKAEEMMRRGHNNGTLGRMKAASEVEAVRPCVVVCASGAGRSAAIVAADTCARALAAGAADVPRTVRDLRAQRPHSLTNRHHYVFVYKVLSEYGNKLMGGGVDTI